ncbi:MAG TPA: ferredoxin [Candidatus Dormibacteraeota bacterium]
MRRQRAGFDVAAGSGRRGLALTRLRVDPIACDGTGACAELFPERIRLDDWGYPIIDPVAIDHQLLPHAQRAVKSCPKMALTIDYPEAE